MSTLLEIQGLVDEAQRKIQAGDHVAVQTILWPDIQSKLGQCTDLEWRYRDDMSRLIIKRLIEQPLHATPTPINLVRLRKDLEEGKVKAPEPSEIPSWNVW